ncbi:unnamed protein product [Anisakis simplex]|uniref:ATP synthase subunit s, mitochondrial n=1 Tax=Anisakis simplex TaxID=6269 RepID=A0A0M3KAN3_ANISI|nr:unnamed protein product [Anisakis simplex]
MSYFCTSYRISSLLISPSHRYLCRRFVSSIGTLKIYSFRRHVAEFFSNKFEPDRVEVLGPDLACLEWLMECGSTQVTMSDGEQISSIAQMRKYIKKFGFDLYDMPEFEDDKIEELRKEYLSIKSANPSEIAHHERWPNAPNTFISQVDASDSAIANAGFAYFRECRQLQSLKLNFCDYFGDEAIRELALGRPAYTLRNLVR